MRILKKTEAHFSLVDWLLGQSNFPVTEFQRIGLPRRRPAGHVKSA